MLAFETPFPGRNFQWLSSSMDIFWNRTVGNLSVLIIWMFHFAAIHKLKEKKSKFVGMVLPCVTRYIRGIQLSDEVVDQKESGCKCPAIQSVLKHVLDFLRPLVQEVSMLSSCSGMVSYVHSINPNLKRFLSRIFFKFTWPYWSSLCPRSVAQHREERARTGLTLPMGIQSFPHQSFRTSPPSHETLTLSPNSMAK